MSDTVKTNNTELVDFGFLVLAVVSTIVAGIGALGIASAMVLEDGGALFLSLLPLVAGAVGFKISLKKHLAIEAADRSSEA